MEDEITIPLPALLSKDNIDQEEDGSNKAPQLPTDTALLEPPLYVTKHVRYVKQLANELSQRTSYEGALTEHLKMSGIYWSLTTLHLLLPTVDDVDKYMNVTTTTNSDGKDDNRQLSIIDWVWSCFDTNTGSFGGNTGHPGHILYTLSALQILALHHQLQSTRLQQEKKKIVNFISQLQQPDGSFVGDLENGGEVDTRFTYCCFQCLALLQQQRLDDSVINVELAVEYIYKCQNTGTDGGYGSCIGAESHAGQVFCCIGALAIAGRLLPQKQTEKLAWWLSERQVDSGGLNGRPEKQADVCYSWWILSSLSILGKISWINVDKLATFILKCQDDVDGGIADRPDDMADVFHTFFGIAGLSLLGHLHRHHHPNIATTTTTTTGEEDSNSPVVFERTIDPIYALPADICRELNLPGQVLAEEEEDGIDERLQHYHQVLSREE